LASTKDPEGAETAGLAELVDFAGKRVLEVGVGDARLTWRYAEPAAFVLGIDPDEENIAIARAETPAELADRVDFRVTAAQDLDEPRRSFDIAFLAWSL
jgi:2-polyprenyl-3-methyl-5-hydroxy-6-metoxy-1,4-benzoquinol methylase